MRPRIFASTFAAALLLAVVTTLLLGGTANAQPGLGDPTGGTVSVGAVRQVNPVPLGGVDSGLAGPGPRWVYLLATLAIAGTAAIGALTAAGRPIPARLGYPAVAVRTRRRLVAAYAAFAATA